MATVLAATSAGCLAFSEDGVSKFELADRPVSAIAHGLHGVCVAVVDGNQVWRRNAQAQWSLFVTSQVELVSLTVINGAIIGGTSDCGLIRITDSGNFERLSRFDSIAGREQWFAQGPPLHVRSLTTTADGATTLAAVHVGGMPRSTNGGTTWEPTVPIEFDIHEVRAHHTSADIVAAASAIGLCCSNDGGKNWQVLAEGPEVPHSLSLALLEEEVLFSVQDGPFAKQSQIWRWKIGEHQISQVREGLPLWLEGRVDTGHMAAGNDRAALVDEGGNLFLSAGGSLDWVRIAVNPHYTFGMLVV